MTQPQDRQAIGCPCSCPSEFSCGWPQEPLQHLLVRLLSQVREMGNEEQPGPSVKELSVKDETPASDCTLAFAGPRV